MAETGKPNPKVESAVERIRALNDRIVDAAKDSGEDALKTYERVLENLAEALEAAGERSSEWIQEFARSQAEFARRLAEAFPALLDRLGVRAREVKNTATAKVHEMPGAAYAEGKARGAVSREQDLPIPGYDELNVHEINERLGRLSQVELGQIDAYEARTKGRKTIRDRIDQLRHR